MKPQKIGNSNRKVLLHHTHTNTYTDIRSRISLQLPSILCLVPRQGLRNKYIGHILLVINKRVSAEETLLWLSLQVDAEP